MLDGQNRDKDSKIKTMGDASFSYLPQEDVVKSGGLDMMKAISDVAEVLIMRHRKECIVPRKAVLRKRSREEESISGRMILCCIRIRGG